MLPWSIVITIVVISIIVFFTIIIVILLFFFPLGRQGNVQVETSFPAQRVLYENEPICEDRFDVYPKIEKTTNTFVFNNTFLSIPLRDILPLRDSKPLFSPCKSNVSALNVPIYLHENNAGLVRGQVWSMDITPPVDFSAPTTTTYYIYSKEFIGKSELTPIYIIQSNWYDTGILYRYALPSHIGTQHLLNGKIFSPVSPDIVGYSL